MVQYHFHSSNLSGNSSAVDIDEMEELMVNLDKRRRDHYFSFAGKAMNSILKKGDVMLTLADDHGSWNELKYEVFEHAGRDVASQTAYINRRDKLGNTALHIAIWNKNYDAAKVSSNQIDLLNSLFYRGVLLRLIFLFSLSLSLLLARRCWLYEQTRTH